MSRSRATCRASAPSASTDRMRPKFLAARMPCGCAMPLHRSAYAAMRRAFPYVRCQSYDMPHNGTLRACACMRWLPTACEACNLSKTRMHVCHYRAGHNVIRLGVHGPTSTRLHLPQQPRLQCGTLWHARTCLIAWQGDQGWHGSQCSSCSIRSCCQYS